MSEYIRKDENGAKVTPQIFTLPFSYKNTSFGLNVDESELVEKNTRGIRPKE